MISHLESYLARKRIMINTKQKIINTALSLGFDKIGFAKSCIISDAAEVSKQSYNNGYFADMNYLYDTISIRENPALLLENAETVIALAVNYYTPFDHSNNKYFGKLSRYAWGDDYHTIIRPKLIELSNFIKTEFNSNTFLSLDGGKVFEKIWAERAGLGWQGKHSLLITPEFGSWVFLAIIITDLIIEPDKSMPNQCGNCNLCINSCPNNAIVQSKIIDTRRCIAYQTIEDRKYLYQDLTLSRAGYLYGCEICQNVCPWNNKPQNTSILSFSPRNNETEISIQEIINMDNTAFNNRFNNSPIKRIKLPKLIDNCRKLSE